MTKRALVVDDDETLRLVTRRQLKALGYEVTLAADGEEAIEVYKEVDFDFIFMDIQMPGLDGFEATNEIRKIQTENGRPRPVIIAVTASLERERARSSGMDDFLFKPVLRESLKIIVDKWAAASC